MSYVATERLFLTEDKSEVVPDGDARAAFLLVAVGQSLPDDVVERYGLAEPVPEKVEPEATSEPEKPEVEPEPEKVAPKKPTRRPRKAKS